MIDLRSDTVTQPTEAMRMAMAQAEVGDDVYGEDPTVNRLEIEAAARIGKEAALFLPSGTMGNQIAILAHTHRGDEIILDEDSHIFCYEKGGAAALAGVQTRTLKGSHGFIEPCRIREAIRDENIHAPHTGLLCLENTHNRAGGRVIAPDRLNAMADTAHEFNIPVHLDGARIFNAALALQIDAKELTEKMDSVMFCLSKGLAAPVGSILAGNKSFIGVARQYRKLLGGGMRQAGILAAAGLVSLNTMITRLVDDHRNALRLAEGIGEIGGLKINISNVQTNILIFNIDELHVDANEFLERLASEGVLAGAFGPKIIRFVTHKDIDLEAVDQAIAILRRTVHQFTAM